MSVVVQLKGHVIPHLPKDTRFRSAVIDVINALDSELDELGYEPGEQVDTAMENLDAALVEDTQEEIDKAIEKDENDELAELDKEDPDGITPSADDDEEDEEDEDDA
jgi:hypothetical protein